MHCIYCFVPQKKQLQSQHFLSQFVVHFIIHIHSHTCTEVPSRIFVFISICSSKAKLAKISVRKCQAKEGVVGC